MTWIVVAAIGLFAISAFIGVAALIVYLAPGSNEKKSH